MGDMADDAMDKAFDQMYEDEEENRYDDALGMHDDFRQPSHNRTKNR